MKERIKGWEIGERGENAGDVLDAKGLKIWFLLLGFFRFIKVEGLLLNRGWYKIDNLYFFRKI